MFQIVDGAALEGRRLDVDVRMVAPPGREAAVESCRNTVPVGCRAGVEHSQRRITKRGF
jgi:hypothetical protein